MKHVVSTDMVAHLWANQAQDEARNSQGNFYFRGNTIYSYGAHFPIAIIDNKNQTVLFTKQDYSKTTSKHKQTVLSAIPGKYAFLHVQNVNAVNYPSGHKANLDNIKKEALDLIPVLFRSRLYKELYQEKIASLVILYNRYRKIYCPRLKEFSLPDNVQKEIVTKIKLEKQKDLELKKEFEKLVPEHIENWRNFIKTEIPKKFKSINQYEIIAKLYGGSLLREKDGTVYTSKNAEFPTAHAKPAWQIVKKCHDTKTEFIPNGHTIHVGSFQIDHIDAEGNVKAGCHYVTFTEIELLAKRLGWTDK